jgi:hypothetical protein
VRGVLTYNYLTQFSGLLSPSQVDLIYDKDCTNNGARLLKFLNKNIPSLSDLSGLLHEFQLDPTRFYFDKVLKLGPPYISLEDGVARLNCDMEMNGDLVTLFVETSIENEKYLLYERLDAFLVVVLPYAMRMGHDISCRCPVTTILLHNIKDVLIPHLVSHDPRLHYTTIIADQDSGDLPCGAAIGAGMSCGIDSLYTAYRYHEDPVGDLKITHLYCGNYLHGNSSDVYSRAGLAANDLGLPLITTRTNINEALPMEHITVHFYKTFFGVIALRKLFRAYYYSTADSHGSFSLVNNSVSDTSNYELLLLYCLSSPEMVLLTGVEQCKGSRRRKRLLPGILHKAT